MEDEQERKQSYLRKEILDNNYDAQSFLDFLITKKGEKASDINNWTIEELKTVVVEFKNANNNNQKENTSSSYILEDLPPADNEVLKINSILTPLSNNKNANINEKNNEYNYSLFTPLKSNISVLLRSSSLCSCSSCSSFSSCSLISLFNKSLS